MGPQPPIPGTIESLEYRMERILIGSARLQEKSPQTPQSADGGRDVRQNQRQARLHNKAAKKGSLAIAYSRRDATGRCSDFTAQDRCNVDVGKDLLG